MQQRTTGSSRGPYWDDDFIDVEAQLEVKQRQPSWRRRMEDMDQHGLPISDHDPRNIGKRETAQSRYAEKWLHAIPLIVLLCFFILWWFSYPGKLSDLSANFKYWSSVLISLNVHNVGLFYLKILYSEIFLICLGVDLVSFLCCYVTFLVIRQLLCFAF